MKSGSRPQAVATAEADAAPKRQEIAMPRTKAGALVSIDATIFKDVKVALEARLGRVEMSVEEVLALKSGAVVQLDRQMNDLIELRLNGAVVARGEIVAVDDNFGVRIVEVAEPS